MANYMGTIRTNYFAVKDEAAFRSIVDSCAAEDTVHIFEIQQDDGSTKFGFGCQGSIYGITSDSDNEEIQFDTDISDFYMELQKIVADDDAIMVTEIGYEKLRYLIGYCTIITSKCITGVDLEYEALKRTRRVLKNKHFTTKNYY